MIDIKKHLKDKKLVVGTKLTVKQLRLGKMQAVFLSSNCPVKVKDEISHYCSISACKVEQLKIPNDELGALCRKPFSISVLGLLK